MPGMTKKYLHLEDGTVLEGEAFGANNETLGEVVFSTGMTGYPESLTDPSFAGQILTFTYPLLGNYGVPKVVYQDKHLLKNFESERIWVQGVVVGTQIEYPSHHASFATFDNWLKQQKIPGVTGVDTRALTLNLREKGVMKGKLTNSGQKISWKTVDTPGTIKKVSHNQIISYLPKGKPARTIALLDCGVKHGIIRALLRQQYKVIRVPYDFDPLKLSERVDGVVCSNGPGDPKDWTETVAIIQNILKTDLPFVGICLGHQLLALAIGADTYKLPYGHRGLNQPCLDISTNKAYVTSQNHGYAVNKKTLPQDFSEWFVNLNDSTNEGIKHKKKPIMSMQFHPEGCPGPFDTEWVFGMFGEL